MKTILIATDFSPASRNALLYGSALAEAVDAKIILFHAYSLPASFPALGVSISKYGVMKDAEQQVADEAALVLQDTSAIEIVCEEGDAANAIRNMATEKQADLIITGMQGSGKNLKRVFGSTAAALALDTQVPVLVIPDEVKFSPFDVIAYAIDANFKGNPDAILELQTFKKIFNSELYLVTVVKNQDEEQLIVSEMQENKTSRSEHTSFQYPVDADISHGLTDFIASHHVNLLAMMPHRHHWATRIFKSSETKNMIFQIDIPLLVLPELTS